MSLARIPLPSIALVLSSDHTALPSRPSVIKFEFDPLQTIHPTFSGSSGVLVCPHLFLFVGSGMWQRTWLEFDWRSRWPNWCANRPRWQPPSRGRTLFLPCCQWFCEFVAFHAIQFRCFICSLVNECWFRYWTARRRVGFSNCVRWEKAQHFTWICVEGLEEWYCHEGVCVFILVRWLGFLWSLTTRAISWPWPILFVACCCSSSSKVLQWTKVSKLPRLSSMSNWLTRLNNSNRLRPPTTSLRLLSFFFFFFFFFFRECYIMEPLSSISLFCFPVCRHVLGTLL